MTDNKDHTIHSVIGLPYSEYWTGTVLVCCLCEDGAVIIERITSEAVGNSGGTFSHVTSTFLVNPNELTSLMMKLREAQIAADKLNDANVPSLTQPPATFTCGRCERILGIFTLDKPGLITCQCPHCGEQNVLQL